MGRLFPLIKGWGQSRNSLQSNSGKMARGSEGEQRCHPGNLRKKAQWFTVLKALGMSEGKDKKGGGERGEVEEVVVGGSRGREECEH